jgi:hypothetical protein
MGFRRFNHPALAVECIDVVDHDDSEVEDIDHRPARAVDPPRAVDRATA